MIRRSFAVPNTTGRLPGATFLLVALAGLCYEPYHAYFDVWAHSPQLNVEFCARCSNIAQRINQMPTSAPKYVVVAATGPRAHGIPVDAAPVMFLTGSYQKKAQEEMNIHYIPPPTAPFNPLAYCREAQAAWPGRAVFCVF